MRDTADCRVATMPGKYVWEQNQRMKALHGDKEQRRSYELTLLAKHVNKRELLICLQRKNKNLNLKKIINFRKHKGLLRPKGLVWFTAWISSEQNCHG